MKIALIHDGIITKGGAERVFLYFCQAFPEADIFTSVYYPEKSYPEFKEFSIHTSWYNTVARNELNYRNFYFPLGLIAAKGIDLRKYDVVLQSTTTGAKYAKISDKAKVISYIHQPFRLLWSPESYGQFKKATKFKRFAYQKVIKYLQKIDYKSVQRSNVVVANSDNTREKIEEVYNRKVDFIVKPPINCSDFYISKKVDDYFLVVSRFEPYKNVDLVIKAFNKLNMPLKVVGDGTQKAYLRKLANSNITFLHNVSQSELSELYSKARALIFPQEEDYGITPLESIASGRPVIGYNKGGILETMIPYNGIGAEATALLFDEQTEEAIIDSIRKFESIGFDPEFIKLHSENFDVQFFKKQIIDIVYS